MMKDAETDIRSMTAAELEELVTSLGEPAYRAGQIFGWLHDKGVSSWEEMKNVPQKLRDELAAGYDPGDVKIVRLQESELDGTMKALFSLSDGNLVESVLMRYRVGDSVCVSSQAGCRMGCAFCASTIAGLERNLTAGEMLAQVYRMEQRGGTRVSHVVVMGSGEPMENYDNVVRFFRLLADEKGKHISLRNMTVSTCGIVPGIRRLADEGIPVNLAISLHAPNDEIRRRIMPVAKRFPMDELLDACREYYRAAGRRLTWEYALMKGVNDSAENAAELADRVAGFNSVVNLIPVNPVKERGIDEPEKRRVMEFRDALKKRGIDVTIRRTLGRDIDGACGQLRAKHMETGGRKRSDQG